MKASFNFQQTWWLCRLAVFMVALVFFINYQGRNRIGVSLFQEFTVLTPKSSDLITVLSNPQVVEPLNVKVAGNGVQTTHPDQRPVSTVPLPKPINVSTDNKKENSFDKSDMSKKEQVQGSAGLTDDKETNATEKQRECDIYKGKWVYDPENSPSYTAPMCPFLSDQVSCQRNGRPDSEYEKWSWQAEGCEIPRFNGKEMLERLRGKRLILVGDSLNRNQWESLACLLYSSVSGRGVTVDVASEMYKVFRSKSHNCSVEFYWNPLLVPLEQDKQNGSTILKLDKLPASAPEWRGADIMVFNSGHWWKNQKLRAWDFYEYHGKRVKDMALESAVAMAAITWARWIDRNVDANKTRVYFRTLSPEHNWKQQHCFNRTEPIMDESFEQTFPKLIIDILEKMIANMRTPVKYLDITKLSEYRVDGHPSYYATKIGRLVITKQLKLKSYRSDCSHWCLPGIPDTWNKLLYASMVVDSHR